MKKFLLKTIQPTDGTVTIAHATDVFTGDIGQELTRWNLNNPSNKSTEAMDVIIEDIDWNFQDYSSDNPLINNIKESDFESLDKLCVTQHQVVSLYGNCTDDLDQEGCIVYFLFKKDESMPADKSNSLFLGIISVQSGLLCTGARRFSLDAMRWMPKFIRPA